jgi:hypothetical protein
MSRPCLRLTAPALKAAGTPRWLQLLLSWANHGDSCCALFAGLWRPVPAGRPDTDAGAQRLCVRHRHTISTRWCVDKSCAYPPAMRLLPGRHAFPHRARCMCVAADRSGYALAPVQSLATLPFNQRACQLHSHCLQLREPPARPPQHLQRARARQTCQPLASPRRLCLEADLVVHSTKCNSSDSGCSIVSCAAWERTSRERRAAMLGAASVRSSIHYGVWL